MIKWQFMCIPFASRNINYGNVVTGYAGYTDYFIFGIRIARFQRTEPWK